MNANDPLAPNMLDYESEYRDFSWQTPPDFNFGRHVLDARAADMPDRPALVWVNTDNSVHETITFAQMKERTDRAAQALLALGLKKGDRVFVQVHRLPLWHYLMVGMFKCGIIPMPGTNLLTEHDIEYRLQRAEASGAIVAAEHAAKVEAVAAKCPTLKHKIVVEGSFGDWLRFDDLPDDGRAELPATNADEPMLIYFTSGTTAFPKMVLHTHASYGLGHYVTAKYWQDQKPTDLHWTLSDTGWAKAAWGKLFGQWHVGAAIFMHDARGKFDSDLTLRLIEQFNVTTFCAPPTAYRMLVLQDLSKYNLCSIRHSMSAGEPINPEVIEQWRKATGTIIYDGYGQTETVNIIANFRCLPVRYGSMGKAVPGFAIEIVDDEGNVLPADEEGHIAVKTKPERPVGLMKEYWLDEEANRGAFVNGWYFTGDRAYKDVDGYFWFVGRADDVIKASGYRIGPFEVESALQAHPAVAESAVVGSPDPIRGTIVKAFIILAPGYAPSPELVKDIQNFVKETTAPYKYPREVEFVEELPKTVSGKIRRVELRQREIERKQA